MIQVRTRLNIGWDEIEKHPSPKEFISNKASEAASDQGEYMFKQGLSKVVKTKTKDDETHYLLCNILLDFEIKTLLSIIEELRAYTQTHLIKDTPKYDKFNEIVADLELIAGSKTIALHTDPVIQVIGLPNDE